MSRRFGEGRNEIPVAISQVYILDAFMRVERWAKLIFAAVAEGDALQAHLSNLKKLTRYVPVNSVVHRQTIADSMLKVGRYYIC
jgi:uncharacterized membrane-anchored protein